jgi:hypothetical protein
LTKQINKITHKTDKNAKISSTKPILPLFRRQ